MKRKFVLPILLLIVFTLAAFGCARSGKPTESTSGEEPALSIVDPASDAETVSVYDPAAELVSEPQTESTTEVTESATAEPTETTTEFQTDPDGEPLDEEVTVNELTEADTSAAPASSTADAIAHLAVDLIGTPFETGASGPGSFDNSGFVYYCCRANGVNIPRRTSEIAAVGTEVSREDLRPGDIVICALEIGGAPGFTGIYIGNGKFVSCNTTEAPTDIRNLESGHWADRFICGRRVA